MHFVGVEFLTTHSVSLSVLPPNPLSSPLYLCLTSFSFTPSCLHPPSLPIHFNAVYFPSTLTDDSPSPLLAVFLCMFVTYLPTFFTPTLFLLSLSLTLFHPYLSLSSILFFKYISLSPYLYLSFCALSFLSHPHCPYP